MAVSAFKSSSRRSNIFNSSTRTNSTSDKETKQDSSSKSKAPPPRRSRSVSAFSRTHLDISSNDFLIKRDNPLFCSSDSSKPQETCNKLKVAASASAAADDDDDDTTITRRGRSVSRNAHIGRNVSGIGRSLSRVDTAARRGRSVSRCPGSRGQYVNSESEVEQEDSISTKYKDSGGHSVNRRPSDQKLSNDSATKLCCSSPTDSYAEVKEKTIKSVCEQMKTFQGNNVESDASATSIYETVRSEVKRAISDLQDDLQTAMCSRSNTTAIATAKATDISADLVSPGAAELVLDIRREYAKKLEQAKLLKALTTNEIAKFEAENDKFKQLMEIVTMESQERAARLRADLAVEEHRGLELTRILKEVLPDPNTTTVQKFCPGRKSSIERRKMSKRLTDEAMAYFDECVSLSTFDSSDFSSPEDPPVNSLGVATPAVVGVSLPHESVSASYCPDNCRNDKQDSWFTHSQDTLELTASSCTKEHNPDQVRLFSNDKVLGRRFSFECRPSETFDFQQDVMKYVRNFEKDTDKVNIDPQIVTSNWYDLDDYNLQASTQSLLFDRVFLKNRLESGSLLLCSGGITLSSSPFASII